jgi:hypothetical protein
MVIEHPRVASVQATTVWVAVAAVCSVLPLVVANLWSGFRFGLTDPVMSVVAPSEQPLSVRSPGGEWAIGLALVWFALAYWQRRMSLWEAALVVVGAAAALARAGNAWIDAIALVLPLARQLSLLRAPKAVLCGLMLVSVGATGYTAYSTRPPALPTEVMEAATQGSPNETVFADWRWAPTLQRELGSNVHIYASGGLASESNDFWIAYLRVAQGHERWAEDLQRLNVDLVVLDTADERPAADLVRQSPDWHVTFDSDGALVAERTHQ